MENWEEEIDRRVGDWFDYDVLVGRKVDTNAIKSFIRELVAAKPCGDCLWSLETPCKKHE